MEFQATAKYIRVSPRKVRLVAAKFAGQNVAGALATLGALPKHASRPLAKLVQSAAANAVKKQPEMRNDMLFIKSLDVMEGPVIKRYLPVSRGMAHTYKKRMTHIRVVLTDEKKGREKNK